MRIKLSKTKILLATAGLLVSGVNVAHAHGGGYVPHHYVGHQVLNVHYQLHPLQPKKHFHRASAYVPATYHAHPNARLFHRHHYWKTPSYVYSTYHH